MGIIYMYTVQEKIRLGYFILTIMNVLIYMYSCENAKNRNEHQPAVTTLCC